MFAILLLTEQLMNEMLVHVLIDVLKYLTTTCTALRHTLTEPSESRHSTADCKCSILEHFVPMKTFCDTL